MSTFFGQKYQTEEILNLRNQIKSQNNLTNISVGLLGGLLMPSHSPFLIYQTWKSHKTLSFIKNKNPWSAFKHILNRDGFFSFYVGCIPYTAYLIIKGRFDTFKFDDYQIEGYVPKNESVNTKENLFNFFIGGVSLGFLGTLVAYPLWNIAIRMMLDIEPVRQYENFRDCVMKVYESEGFIGFFKGVQYDLVYDVFNAALKTLKFYLKMENNQNEVVKHYPNLALTFFEMNITYAFEVMKSRAVIGYEWPQNLGLFGFLGEIYTGFLYHAVVVNGPTVVGLGLAYSYNVFKQSGII